MHSQVITKEEMTCPIRKTAIPAPGHLKQSLYSRRWNLETAQVGWTAWVAVVSREINGSPDAEQRPRAALKANRRSSIVN